jgi:hypothetical protein
VNGEHAAVDNDTYRAELRRARRSRMLSAVVALTLTFSFGAAGEIAQHVRRHTVDRRGD